jgi:hypothetical protein
MAARLKFGDQNPAASKGNAETLRAKNGLVAALGLAWNHFVPWLREMDDLRRSNLFTALKRCAL